MNEGATGSKYDSSLSTKEIARRFRQDVRDAKRGGALPKGLKVSVRIRYGVTTTAIDATITALPGIRIMSPDWDPNNLGGSASERFTPDARRIRNQLDTMLQAYNYDNSDARIDHFDVKFYGRVAYDWRLEQAEEPVPA